MEHILTIGQTYADWIIMGILLCNLLVMFLMVHRITTVKKQLKKITDQVEDYIRTIMENEEENVRETEEKRKMSEKDAQTQLISSVLEEIFP